MTQAPVPPPPGRSPHSQSMSAMTRVHNPSTYELVVDSEGHILPGRATTTASVGDAVTARLVAAQRLVILPDPAPPAVEEPTPRSRKKPAPAPAAPAVAEDGENTP